MLATGWRGYEATERSTMLPVLALAMTVNTLASKYRYTYVYMCCEF